ncbi:hypothetical protein [Flavihumibacter sp. CACIAM 22H1]|uniref:hypothetical protein n=1 Tax=Flavihumibacter sp. CACIAM 22H1 TaxID=1812911 RepID=UPI0007A93484|nr:hypothetical protein [Flavihumibacter sp. CACIAM 22H1]KYP16574.1 MAG: hypothetical protein A1D16_09140 [Flavihumibacter sp. CACIAM 22H1]
MKSYWLLLSSLLLLGSIGCDKKNKELILPLTTDKFPQVIKFADDKTGELENSDEFSITLTLTDRVDPEGAAAGGKIIPLQADVRVFFTVAAKDGIDQLADFIKGGTAVYEIDDCTNSADQGIDLQFQFDAATGLGSVIFPKGVEEIELVFEVEDTYLNDALLNEEERAIEFKLVSLEASAENVVVNTALSVQVEFLDEEGIHGTWELDLENQANFAAFKALFGLVNEEIAALELSMVEKVEIEIELDEVNLTVELKETELAEECGETAEVHKRIELELEIEELDYLVAAGNLEAIGELEGTDNSLLEYLLRGNYTLSGNQLQLQLQNEFDKKTVEATLFLNR